MTAPLLALAAALPLAACATWTVLGTLSILGVKSSPAPRPVDDAACPPVTVLKPLAGADANLEACLASFFEQDHPRFELLFGAVSADDPALAVVARLRERYPAVAVKVVVHSGRRGINPKVANLLGMVDEATHDVVLVSDSNVLAPPHYVREAAAILAGDREPGLVTHLFCGTGEDTLGAALESVQLAGFCASGTALPSLAGDPLVVGKSMMMSRATLTRLGGFERVADVLAEDWLLGRTFHHAGLPVRVAPTILRTVTRGATLAGFAARQLRWTMLRARLRPTAQALEVVTSPLALLPLATWLWGLGPAVVFFALVLLARDVCGWVLMRGLERAWLPLLVAPLREVLMLAVWLRAPFKRHIVWRGHRIRLGMGTYGFVTAERRRSRRHT